MGGVQDIQIVPKAAEVRGLGVRGRRIVPRAPVRGAGGGPPGGGGIGVDRNPYAVDVSSDAVQTLTNGAWDLLDIDTNNYEDTAGWTVDLVADTVTQDVAGPVILLGQMTSGYSIWQASRLRLLRNGAQVDGTESPKYADQLATKTAHCLAMVNGSASDAYKIEARKDTASRINTNTSGGWTGNAGGLTAFFAPNDVIYAYANTGDLTLNTTWQDLPLTAGDNVGGMILTTNEITLDETADYLIIYMGNVRHTSNAYHDFYVRLVVDTGGGYGAIAGTTLLGMASRYTGASSQGSPIRGSIIYSATAGDKLKVQLRGEVTTLTTGNGSGIVVVKLPSSWQGFYGYEAAPTGNYLAGTASELGIDTVVRSEGGFSLSGNGVQCPSAATKCLVMGTITAFKRAGTTYAVLRAMIYRDPGGLGSPARVDQANTFGHARWSGSYGGGVASMTQQVMDLTADDILTLQALHGNTGARNGGQLVVLRLDNLTP